MGRTTEAFVWDFSGVPDHAIISEAGRRRRAMSNGRPKVMHACKHCGKMFGAKEVRQHWPVCPKKPKHPRRKTAISTTKKKTGH